MKLFWQITAACLLGFWASVSANPLILLAGSSNTGGGEAPPPDVTAPTLVSRSINGTTLIIDFSEVVSQGAGYNNSDLDLDMSTTGSNIALTYVSGNGTATWTYTAASPAVFGETVDIDFNGDANSIEDAAGNDLAAVVSSAVTNATASPSPGTANLRAWYALDDASGNFTDQTANTYTMAVTGGLTYSQTGKLSSAVLFNGTTGRGAIDNNYSTRIYTYPFSMSTWVKTTNAGNQIAFGVSEKGSSSRYFYLGTNSGVATMMSRGTGATPTSLAGGTINDGNWHHLVGVWVNSTERYFYVDGALATGSPGLDAHTPNVNMGTVTLGALSFSSSVSLFFNGTIDDTAFWSTNLTLAHVQYLYNSGTGRGFGSL